MNIGLKNQARRILKALPVDKRQGFIERLRNKLDMKDLANEVNAQFDDLEAVNEKLSTLQKNDVELSGSLLDISEKTNVALQDIKKEVYVMNASGGNRPLEQNRTIKSGDYTLNSADEIVVFTSTANASLPQATGGGHTYRICNESDGGVVTIIANGTDTIKKELTQQLFEGEDLIITDYLVGKWA